MARETQDERDERLQALSTRECRIEHLKLELADKRMRKALKYETYAANLQAWIDYFSQLSDEAYEQERLKVAANGFSQMVGLSGREHSPEEVFSGAWGERDRQKAQALIRQYRFRQARP